MTDFDTDTVYVVKAGARYSSGDVTSTFPEGCRVRLTSANKDSDGDFYARNLETEETNYVLPEYLTEETPKKARLTKRKIVEEVAEIVVTMTVVEAQRVAECDVPDAVAEAIVAALTEAAEA